MLNVDNTCILKSECNLLNLEETRCVTGCLPKSYYNLILFLIDLSFLSPTTKCFNKEMRSLQLLWRSNGNKKNFNIYLLAQANCIKCNNFDYCTECSEGFVKVDHFGCVDSCIEHNWYQSFDRKLCVTECSIIF